MSLVDRLRQPAYTGENRRVPCTIANVMITGVGSAALATKSKRLGGAAFAASLGAIHLRGYLVPGTPTLTKRYFPDQVLRWFDKERTSTSIPVDDTDDTIRIDPEQVLLDARAVTLCEDGTDLCPQSDFRASRRERRHALKSESPDSEDLLVALDAPVDVSVEEYGDALVAGTDDRMLGQWPSQAAVVVDVAAAAELAERYPDWERLNPAERARVLTSLRIFIEECPECDGPVRVEQEVVESCCMSHDVVVSACQNCDAQLFEIEWDDEFATAPNASSDEPESNAEHPTHAEA
jgi:hypothetical protein